MADVDHEQNMSDCKRWDQMTNFYLNDTMPKALTNKTGHESFKAKVLTVYFNIGEKLQS